jgi:hypothetical protein
VPKLSRHRDAWRREVDVTGTRMEFRGDAAGDGHTFEPLQEVDMKEGTAELAIRDAFQSDRLLFPHDIADRLILRRAQLGVRDLVVLEVLARVPEPAGPEQAADVIGPERWIQP